MQGRHEERASQKCAKISISPGEIEAPDSHDSGCNYVEGNDHAFLLSSPFSAHLSQWGTAAARPCRCRRYPLGLVDQALTPHIPFPLADGVLQRYACIIIS
jgi:hypothetical protein